MSNRTTSLTGLLDIMALLRAEKGGCDWCRRQTFETISAYTQEEAFEVADAIVEGDRNALCDELGDLLLQVVFHARMAEEEGSFCFADVVAAISEKLVRRHPQVFAGDKNYQANAADWEAIKRQERAEKGCIRQSLMDGIPAALPALLQAEKIQKKAALVGFDWPDKAAVLDKLDEEVSELKDAIAAKNAAAAGEELGDVFFTLVNLSRHLEKQKGAEQSLRQASHKFADRFRKMEQMARHLADLSDTELDALWQQAKKLQKAEIYS